MAVIAISETWFGATGKRIWRRNRPGEPAVVIREYLRVFLVETNSRLDGPKVVANGRVGLIAIPRIGEPYVVTLAETDLAALCVDVDPRRMGDAGHIWEVVCRYSSEVPPGDPHDPETPPWELPATDVEWGIVRKRQFWTEDLNGVPFVNSAGEPFGPQEFDDPFITYRCTRAERPFATPGEHLDRLEWVDSVNELEFYRHDPKTCRMDNIRIAFKVWQGRVYPIITYEVLIAWWFDSEGDPLWDPWKILDEGNFKLDTAANKLNLIREKRDGSALGKKVLLDRAGQPLAPDGTPKYLDFSAYEVKDWTPLNLPEQPEATPP